MTQRTHTIAFVKRQAKNIKKERGLAHMEALDLVSIQLGYSNWMHCQRSLGKQIHPGVLPIAPDAKISTHFQLSFTKWLKRHKNRNSALGDFATDATDDKRWPAYESLEKYESYLDSRGAVFEAKEALKRVWKTYQAYLKKKNAPGAGKKQSLKAVVKKHDPRKIVFVSNVSPIHFKERSIEKFNPSDKAWISWNGRKAIPVTILQVENRHYTLRVERPLQKAGDEYSLFLDEVRSTPELACINNVTF